MMGFDYAAKIRGLLANADNEALPDEVRATYRTKAFEWMDRYRIDEENALAADPTLVTPTHVVIDFSINSTEVLSAYPEIIRVLAKHTGIRVNIEYRTWDSFRVTAVGYDGDLRFFQLLWTGAHLMFSTRIDPTWDPARPEAENVYLMRQAGIKRREIAERAWGNGDVAAARSRVQRMYLAEVARRGESATSSGLGFNSRDYRRAYADSFVMTLARRLRVARDAANSVAGLPVHSGRSERVDEAFYLMFPRLRPKTDVAAPYVAPNADCARCAKAASGFCRGHGWLKPREATQADLRRWDRQANGSSARAGAASGRTAAEGVGIQRGHTTENRVTGAAREIGD